MNSDQESELDSRIAVIGMSGRFPGAADVDTFWSNLRAGVESIRRLSVDDLRAGGVADALINDPEYVPAAARLDDIDRFDASFFGMSPRDASVFDPQHRIMLECAWEAFENAGYVGGQIEASVGVFASCGLGEYLFRNVLANREMVDTVGEWLIRHTGNDTNFLATRISYELDLDGPSLSVQTACSSSLVAVHLACQSLLNGECDVALAGGAVVTPRPPLGYLYKEGEILSPDGHCRPFDAASAGTVESNAAGCVVLKPLAAARADGDRVLAVILGSAINNDARDKVGYLAPSVGGQARVVTEALAVAGIDPRQVGYVEAHGTGTLIGDPIEIAGLTRAFRQGTDDTQFCAIGSLKSNIGHGGEAAGIAGLIKTVLMLHHGELVPSLHYASPNPRAGLPESPFYVNTETKPWRVAGGERRIAGITGLGAGGTNAHIVLVEAPSTGAGDGAPKRSAELITLAARSPEALRTMSAQLAAHLEANPDVDLADVAFTRLVGRCAFRARRSIVASSTAEAARRLAVDEPATAPSRNVPSVAFLLPGGGAQYAGMGAELYRTEAVYRQAFDECLALMAPALADRVRSSVLVSVGDADAALQRPSLGLPALFATQWAMAAQLRAWGIEPAAMIGHSVGEYAVACLSGVLSLADALAMVTLRGRLFETLPDGGMLSVLLPEPVVTPLLPAGLSIAAVNTSEQCVVSGPVALLDRMAEIVAAHEGESMRVHIDVAAHSSMLAPILAEFGAWCRTTRFNAPQIPYVSNLTGTWITPDDVTDPDYWVRHLRHTVRFADGLATLAHGAPRMLIEVGPGQTLTSFARQSGLDFAGSTPTMRHPKRDTGPGSSDVEVLLAAAGRVWASGCDLDGAAMFAGQRRQRVAMPTYPFERRRHWVDPDPAQTGPLGVATGSLDKRLDVASWFTTPSWHQAVVGGAVGAARSTPGVRQTTLLVGDTSTVGDRLVRALRRRGDNIVHARFGDQFARPNDGVVSVNPALPTDWLALVDLLRSEGTMPDRIVHLGRARRRRWLGSAADRALAAFDDTVNVDHASLLFLAQALSSVSTPIRLAVVTQGGVAVADEAVPNPDSAMLHGVARVIPRELGHVSTVTVDIDAAAQTDERIGDRLVAELDAESADIVAYRGGRRLVRQLVATPLPPIAATPWQQDGVFLITGGLGGIGITVAERIAATADHPTLVLLGRTALPPESEWHEVVGTAGPGDPVSRRIRAVRRMRSQGARVVLVAADVTDGATLAPALAAVTAQVGSFTTVIHAAGILRDGLIALRTPVVGSPVIDIKARGLLVLDRVLGSSPPQLMVLFSSVSSLLGLAGQVDYTAANAFLDAFAAAKTNATSGSQRTRTVVVNWNAWQGVGMAAELLVDQRGDDARRPQRGATPGWFDDVLDDGDTVTCTVQMSRRQWVLDEHVVVGGDAVMPGTGTLELMRAAAVEALGGHLVRLSDVFFLASFVVGPDEVRALHVRVERSTGAVVVFSDDESEPHAVGSAELIVDMPAETIDLDAVRWRCHESIVTPDGRADQPFMQFGSRWSCLRRVDLGDAEAVLTCRLDNSFVHEVDAAWLHPALLDMATGGAQRLIHGFLTDQSFMVPFAYQSVTVHRSLPAAAVSVVRLRPESVADLAVFDVSICDEAGEVAVEVEGFTMRRVAEGAAFGRRGAAGIGAGESTLVAALRQGISPEEGVDALERLLAVDVGAQVVVSSVDIRSWIAQIDVEAAALAGGDDGLDDSLPNGTETAQRPHLHSAFEAPSTPIERRIAAMWQELLGLGRVGRNDDFFELGGQSLVAVRLFTRIRKAYTVDLPLATLFEAPTVAQCAAVVAARLGIVDRDPSDAGEAGDGPAPVAPLAHTFTSLVTIQRGVPDASTNLPFFCVHGSGGNTLNFRDLSLRMGRDQPFYGLQARGIDGVLRPHDSIEEMATAYLAEIRAVQQEGPYLLGGYSGGGLVAYEMAQQLTVIGQRVALVLLLDTLPPVLPVKLENWRTRLHKLRTDPRQFARVAFVRRVQARRQARMAERVHELLAAGGAVPISLREQHLGGHFGAIGARYERKPWEGRVVLMRPQQMNYPFDRPDEAYGWDELVGEGFELIETPGTHLTILVEPNVGVLVRLFADTLRSAQPAHDSPSTHPLT